jgi:hypothetical protein
MVLFPWFENMILDPCKIKELITNLVSVMVGSDNLISKKERNSKVILEIKNLDQINPSNSKTI